MSELPLFDELVSMEIPLDRLFLDPNNPRFAEFEQAYVEDAEIEAAQDRVYERLLNKYDIGKLRMNMEVNGYLPIDRVIVREFEPDKYVLLEGNRRIAAAKNLTKSAAKRADISKPVQATLSRIPCLLYTGSDKNAAWIFQGLRHITGVFEWSAFNKAKLLFDQMEEENINLTDVGKRFGLTSHGAGQWVR